MEEQAIFEKIDRLQAREIPAALQAMLTQAATILQPSSISNTNNKTTTIKKSAAIKKSLAKGILLLLDRCCANPTATTTITGADDAPLLLGTQCQDIVTFSMKHNPWMWDLFIKKHSDDLLTLPTAALILTTGLVGQSSAATRARGYSLLALMTTQHRLDDIVGKTNSMLSISNIFSVLYGQLDNYCVHPDVDRREEEEEEEEIVEEEEEEEEKKKEKGSLLSEDFPALLQVLLRLITWLPQEEQQQKQQQLLLLSIACDVGFMLKSPEQLHRLLDVQLLPSTQSSMQNTVGMLAPVDIKKVTTAQALLMVVLEAIATIPKFAMQLLFHDNKNTDKQGSSTSYEDAAAAAEATPPFWSHVGNVLDPGSQHYARLPAEQEVIYWKLVKVIATCLSLHWELTKLLQAASTSSSSTSSINSNRRNTRREDKGPRPCRLAPWTLDTCSWLLSVVAPFTDDCSNSNTGDEMDKASNAMENGLNANNIINSGSRRNNRAILSAKIDSTTTTSNCDAAIVLGSSTIHRSFTSMRMVEGGSEKEEASPVGTTTTTTTTGISSNILSCVFLVPPTIIAHLLGLVKKTNNNNNNNNNNAIIPPPSLPSLSLEEASTAMTYIQRLISVQTTAHQGLSKPYTVMEGSAHNDAIYVANTLHDLLTALPEEIMIDADQVVEEEEVKEEGDGGQGRAEEGLPTAEVLANAEKPSNVIDKGEDLTNSYTNGAAAEPSGAIEDLMQLFQSPPPAPCPPQQQQRVTTITTNKGDRKHIVPEQRKVSPGLHNDNNLDKPHQEEEGEGEEEAKVIIPNATMVIDRVVIRAMPAMTDEERELMWAAYIADKDRMVDMMGDADYNEWFDEAANPLPMLTKAPDTEAALDALLGGTGNAATDAELSKKRRISTLPKTVEEASFSSPWQASVAGALFLLSEWVGAGAGVGDDNNRLDGVQQQHCVVELMHRCHKPLRKKTVREALKLINPSHTMSAVQAAMKRADAQPTGSTVLHLVYQLHAILEWGGGHRLTPCLLEAYSAVLEVLLPLAVKEEEQEEGQGNAPMPSPSTNTLPPSSTATATKRGGGTSPLHLASSILFSGSLLIHPTVLSPTSSNLIIALTARYLQPADAVVQYTSSLIWGAFFGGHVLSKRLTTTQAENDANINNSTKNSAGNDTNKREGGSNKIKKRKKAKIMQAVQPPWLHLSCKQLEEEVSMSPLPMTDVHTRASSLTALLTLLEPSLEQVMVACQGSVQEDGKYQVMEGHRVLQCIVPAFDATAVIVQALLDHHCPKSEKKADSFNSINNIVAALLATATSTEVELFYKALGRVIECLLIVCMEAAEDLALHINTVVSSSSTSDGLMEAMNCAGPLTALVALSLEFTNIIDQLLDACSGGEDGNDGNDGNDGDDTGGAPGTSAPFNNNYDKKSNSNNKMKELSLLLSLNKVKAAHTQSEEKLSSCLDLLRAFPEDSPMSAMFTKSVEAAPSLLVKMNAHSSLNDVLWMLEKMEGQQGGGGGGGGGGYYSEITDDGSTEEEDSDDDDDDDEGVEGGDAQQQLLAIKQKKRRKGKEIKKNKKKRKMADIQNPYLRAILSESHYGGAREEVVDDGDDLSDLEDFIVYNPGRDYDAFILEHFPTKEEDEVDVDDDGDGEGEGNDLCGGG